MSNLNRRGALDPRWISWGSAVLDAFAVCEVDILDPNIDSDGSNFNPYAPPVTTPVMVVWSGTAQIQVYRQSLTVDDVAGSVAQIRSIRITLPLPGPSVPIRKGMIVRVTAAPGNSDAESFEYTVTSGMSSPLSRRRTIEAEADQSVVT